MVGQGEAADIDAIFMTMFSPPKSSAIRSIDDSQDAA